VEPVNQSVSISLPSAASNASWTHRASDASHKSSHVALRNPLEQIWSVSIGEGDSRRSRITADPVVLNNRIFTLDAESNVMAHGVGGAKLWSASLVTARDKSDEVSGGGLAIADNILVVGTGFGRLVALDAATGGLIWEQRLNTQISGPPTIANGNVYVSTRDSRGWALNLANGKIQWQVQGAPARVGVAGGAAPAVNSEVAIFPVGNTELLATFPKGGIRLWSASASGQRQGKVYATTSDLTSDPVIDGDKVYVGSQSGRLVALDIGSGERIWTAQEGSYTPALPIGGSVFVISDQNELLRLDASNGERIWGIELPYFKKDLASKRRDVYSHFGPIMAGGRLLVASGDGVIRSFNPETGALISTVTIDGGATANPAVAGGTLYVVSRKGKLHAFR
ncbi:MAG: PQQ-binding-like beta-propeller repeat protein, partial [Pseudoruegeria sp.]